MANHVECEHVLAASSGAAAHALVRLGNQTHTVAASITYGCSLHQLRLQPPPATVAGWSALVLASTQRCSASRSYRATDSGAFRQRATSGGRRGASHLGSTHGQRSCSAWALHGARWRAGLARTTEGAPGRRQRRGALSTSCSAITLPSSTLPRTYCPMQSSQKACAQPASTAASAGGVSHMQIGQVTSAAGRSQSAGRPEPAAAEAEDEDEEDPADAEAMPADAEAPEEEGAACGGLKGEAAPLSSWSLSRSMGAAAVSPPRRAGAGRRGESTVRSTTARFR